MNGINSAIFGIFFIFLMTSLGSALVFLFKNRMNEKLCKAVDGFSSGIMLAASIWSLLLPAIDQSASFGKLQFLPAAVGFLIGVLFLEFINLICKKISKNGKKNSKNKQKASKLFFVMTLHNIPEGLAVGVAFGGAGLAQGNLLLALSLAIGIGIQNIPEGTAIALPMSASTGSKLKGFLLGVASGVVEPIAAVIGLFLASLVSVIMPWALSFAAGAMVFVVTSELLPECAIGEGGRLGVWMAMIGFLLMMILDVALG